MAKHPMRDAVWRFLTAWLTMATVLCARGASQDHAGWIDKVDADYRNAPPEAVEAWKDLKYGMRINWSVLRAGLRGLVADVPCVAGVQEHL